MQNKTDYMQHLESLGLMEGRPGAQQMNSNVAEVFNALHHVMAGGEARITIEQAGNSAIVEELETKQKEAMKRWGFLTRFKNSLCGILPP